MQFESNVEPALESLDAINTRAPTLVTQRLPIGHPMLSYILGHWETVYDVILPELIPISEASYAQCQPIPIKSKVPELSYLISRSKRRATLSIRHATWQMYIKHFYKQLLAVPKLKLSIRIPNLGTNFQENPLVFAARNVKKFVLPKDVIKYVYLNTDTLALPAVCRTPYEVQWVVDQMISFAQYAAVMGCGGNTATPLSNLTLSVADKLERAASHHDSEFITHFGVYKKQLRESITACYSVLTSITRLHQRDLQRCRQIDIIKSVLLRGLNERLINLFRNSVLRTDPITSFDSGLCSPEIRNAIRLYLLRDAAPTSDLKVATIDLCGRRRYVIISKWLASKLKLRNIPPGLTCHRCFCPLSDVQRSEITPQALESIRSGQKLPTINGTANWRVKPAHDIINETREALNIQINNFVYADENSEYKNSNYLLPNYPSKKDTPRLQRNELNISFDSDSLESPENWCVDSKRITPSQRINSTTEHDRINFHLEQAQSELSSMDYDNTESNSRPWQLNSSSAEQALYDYCDSKQSKFSQVSNRLKTTKNYINENKISENSNSYELFKSNLLNGLNISHDIQKQEKSNNKTIYKNDIDSSQLKNQEESKNIFPDLLNTLNENIAEMNENLISSGITTNSQDTEKQNFNETKKLNKKENLVTEKSSNIGVLAATPKSTMHPCVVSPISLATTTPLTEPRVKEGPKEYLRCACFSTEPSEYLTFDNFSTQQNNLTHQNESCFNTIFTLITDHEYSTKCDVAFCATCSVSHWSMHPVLSNKCPVCEKICNCDQCNRIRDIEVLLKGLRSTNMSDAQIAASAWRIQDSEEVSETRSRRGQVKEIGLEEQKKILCEYTKLRPRSKNSRYTSQMHPKYKSLGLSELGKQSLMGVSLIQLDEVQNNDTLSDSTEMNDEDSSRPNFRYDASDVSDVSDYCDRSVADSSNGSDVYRSSKPTRSRQNYSKVKVLGRKIESVAIISPSSALFKYNPPGPRSIVALATLPFPAFSDATRELLGSRKASIYYHRLLLDTSVHPHMLDRVPLVVQYLVPSKQIILKDPRVSISCLKHESIITSAKNTHAYFTQKAPFTYPLDIMNNPPLPHIRAVLELGYTSSQAKLIQICSILAFRRLLIVGLLMYHIKTRVIYCEEALANSVSSVFASLCNLQAVSVLSQMKPSVIASGETRCRSHVYNFHTKTDEDDPKYIFADDRSDYELEESNGTHDTFDTESQYSQINENSIKNSNKSSFNLFLQDKHESSSNSETDNSLSNGHMQGETTKHLDQELNWNLIGQVDNSNNSINHSNLPYDIAGDEKSMFNDMNLDVLSNNPNISVDLNIFKESCMVENNFNKIANSDLNSNINIDSNISLSKQSKLISNFPINIIKNPNEKQSSTISPENILPYNKASKNITRLISDVYLTNQNEKFLFADSNSNIMNDSLMSNNNNFKDGLISKSLSRSCSPCKRDTRLMDKDLTNQLRQLHYRRKIVMMSDGVEFRRGSMLQPAQNVFPPARALYSLPIPVDQIAKLQTSITRYVCALDKVLDLSE